MITDILKVGGIIIDKLFPDKDEANRQKLRLMELDQNGELTPLLERYKAINTEGGSADKWTSRARPSFLYVMYVMILASIPMGVLYVFYPEGVKAAIEGMQLWLSSIPDSLYTLFGVGYLGYGGFRTIDKIKNGTVTR